MLRRATLTLVLIGIASMLGCAPPKGQAPKGQAQKGAQPRTIPAILETISARLASSKYSKALAHYAYAHLLESQNKNTEAIAEYQKSLEYDPDSFSSHLRLAALYIKSSCVSSRQESRISP